MNVIEIDHVTEEPLESPDLSNNDNCWNIEESSLENVQYQDFFTNFMIKNLPCIVRNISSNWECSNIWIHNNTINYNYFIEKYGDMDVPVADCDNIAYNSQCKCNMKVSDYMNYLKTDDKTKSLYLKDWHLRKSQPNDKFYEIPQIFASDWLNEYAQDNQEDDFMFVYIGPKNSWTPLHADVYSSYSWSVNIVGKKKWILFPPGEEDKLKDSLGNLPLMFEPAIHNGINYFEVIQEKGDAIFVPSGWYHQVVNQQDTISVNHNWVNACNIMIVWKALLKALSSVEHEIREFKESSDFFEQCQLILKSIFGMDCVLFINFLCYIGQKRLSQVNGGCRFGLDTFPLGKNQILFDLRHILNVMNAIQSHSIFHNKGLLSTIKFDFINIKDSLTKVLK